MVITLYIQIYFCIFFTFLHTEGTHNKRENVDIINNLLHQPGWKNINDVEYITYRRNVYTLKDVLNKPVTLQTCDNCIRYTTIFLGCSYANDLHTMFCTFFKFQEYCYKLLRSGQIIAHNCTVKLLEKMIELVPIAKFIKGALYAIEKYHNRPLNTQNRVRFLLSKVFINLQKIETLKKLVPLENNKDSINTALFNITEILLTSDIKLKDDVYLCKIKQLDITSLWNFWINEFFTQKSQKRYDDFIIFLSDKMSNLFLTTIWKKYVELGFKFDSNTSETFLPALPHTNVKQDIVKNRYIHLTQYTNEVDMMENIQQEYIIQNTCIQHYDIIENHSIQNYNITQYPSLNLIQHTNKIDMQEAIQQHDFTQYPFINLIQHTTAVDKQERIRQENVICETEPETGELIVYPEHMIPFNKYL